MKLEAFPFAVTTWEAVEPVAHSGETGVALWRTITMGDIRIRRVDYSPHYLADHWCRKGHILTVLSGRMITELEDGRQFEMVAGTTYRVGDDCEAHRSRTEAEGASLLIVD